METKPPLPPFTEETAREKVQMAENALNIPFALQISAVSEEGPGLSDKGFASMELA